MINIVLKLLNLLLSLVDELNHGYLSKSNVIFLLRKTQFSNCISSIQIALGKVYCEEEECGTGISVTVKTG